MPEERGTHVAPCAIRRSITGTRRVCGVAAAMQQAHDAIIRVACPQVSGSGLLPFTIDKQTLLLQTFTQQLNAMNLSVSSVNLSSVRTLSTAAGRSGRRCAVQDTVCSDSQSAQPLH